ncbi:class I SAM-dependent methyltransferase [Aeromicrobium endophyticum]|uniref:Methyltransferase domain-containing protein n=1 Tax=Aeromicrobium endophyticum TaxID=2292704 RepID=A0A371PA29_9ACTN|nr:methyltransferase [Aeromicrobium endophyticum]REK72366.1 methyltransferase domain-containing protein [Aeromicrobium endophyticum]
MADHYFDPAPASDDRRHEVTAVVWGRELTFTTSSGVFSHDGLDKATAVLLRTGTAPSGGTVLDLGCGWGPIACSIASASPAATVWAVDVNERALELTRLNAEHLGVEVHAALPAEVPTDVVFDQIWSNPPIRVGKQALHELLLLWLPRLAPGGTALLVVGKNLGSDSLQRWLVDQGWPTARLGSEKGFRVLEVRRAS